MSLERSAVVLMARDPRLEAAQKRLVGRRCVAVHAAFLAAAAERLRSPRADLVIAWEGDDETARSLKPRAVVGQRGRSFGERLANAARDAAALAYKRLLIVGIDAPAIDAARLEEALSGLDGHDLVLAPSSDGGVNLIGVSAAALNRVELRLLPWMTGALCEALEHMARSAGLTILFLAPSDDIDTTEGLTRYLRQEPNSLLARLVQRALEHDAGRQRSLGLDPERLVPSGLFERSDR